MIYHTEYAEKVKELAQGELKCFFGEYDVHMYANFHKNNSLEMLVAFLWIALAAATNFLHVHIIVTVLVAVAFLVCLIPVFKLLVNQPKELIIARVCYGVFFVVIYVLYAYRKINDIAYIWSLTAGFVALCVHGILFHSRKRKEILRFNVLQKRCETLANDLMALKAENKEGVYSGRHFWWEVSRYSVDQYIRRYGRSLGEDVKAKCERVNFSLAVDMIKKESTPFIPLANDSALEDRLLRLKSSALRLGRTVEEEKRLLESLSSYRFYYVSATEIVTREYETEKSDAEVNAEISEAMQKHSSRMDSLERFSNGGVFTNDELYFSGRDSSIELRSRRIDRDLLGFLQERDVRKSAEASRTRTHRYKVVINYNIGYCVTTDEPKPRLLAVLPIHEDKAVGDTDWALLVIQNALRKIPDITLDIYEPTPENGNSLYQAYAVYFRR